jgi:uncharacterized membrane protein
MGFALSLHLLFAVIWVGGMFFAYVFLRPAAAALLDAGTRSALWAEVLAKFFIAVLTAIPVLLASGLYMIFGVMGGMESVGLHVHIMLGAGILMMLLALHVYFAPLRRLRAAVIAGQTEAAVKAVGQIRKLVAVNLALGLLVVLVASGGRYIIG